MIQITPIRERDGNQLHREFFTPEFIAYRLGRPGQWQGSAAAKLGLSKAVEPEVFTNLLQGRSAEGESLLRNPGRLSDRILGWRISLAAEAPTSVLWGLSPPVIRGRIQAAHANAVRHALTDFESHLNGRPRIENPYAPGRTSTIFAKFHSGASVQQTPRLETNVFLFNLVFQSGHENTVFTPKRVAGQGRRMHSVYQRAMGRAVARTIGTNVSLSDELTLRFEGHPPGTGDARRSARVRYLPGHELFDRWQQQAMPWGWGPARTSEWIGKNRSRLTVSNLVEDARTIGRLWAIALRHPAHSPHRVGEVIAASWSRSQTTTAGSGSQDKGMSH